MATCYKIIDGIPRLIIRNETGNIIKNTIVNEDQDVYRGYITGFYDAEGGIGIYAGYALQAYITQAYLPVLNWINGIFPGVVKIHSPEGFDKNGGHHKDSWRWIQISDNAIPFLEFVNKYSIEKRPQIDIALKYQKEEKITYSRGKERRNGLSQTEIEKRDWFVNELKRLNLVRSPPPSGGG